VKLKIVIKLNSYTGQDGTEYELLNLEYK